MADATTTSHRRGVDVRPPRSAPGLAPAGSSLRRWAPSRTRPALEPARQRRTVRNLAVVRWAAIIWAVVQITTYYRPYPPGVAGRRRTPRLVYVLESWSDAGDDDIVALLESSEAFAGLGRDRLRDLLALFEPLHLAAGDVVFGQGDEADALYLVGYGRLRGRPRGGRHHDAGDRGRPGDDRGRGRALAGTKRATTARAVRYSLVLRLS